MMTSKEPIATMPGEMLIEEFLKPKGWTQAELAKRMGTTVQTINRIAKGKQAITADMAIKLESVFGVSAGFWLNLQTAWDLQQARARAKKVA